MSTTAENTQSIEPDVQKTELDFKVSCSRHFAGWLEQEGVSLTFSTYQTGELFLIGRNPTGELSIFERRFDRCMGLWTNGQTLWLASRYQLWRLENTLDEGQTEDGYDRLFVPQVGYTTGDVDVHDMTVDAEGRLVFVCTLGSCLATTSERYSLEPFWHPPFVSRFATEDRCHLNGLAPENGTVRYVTACSQSDVADGWRDSRHDGGCVIDVADNTIVSEGFSMPHSPRIYRDKLWLLDSGNGYLGYVDRSTGQFEQVAFCPGFARGLTFIGNYAVVGLSKPRRDGSFQGLALDENLAERNAKARCGLQVIDLRSGDAVHWLRIDGSIQELYDVVAMPGVRRPKALGFLTNEIHHSISIPSDEVVARIA
jgi:uncharacterized protein (TIGR03032 family)